MKGEHTHKKISEGIVNSVAEHIYLQLKNLSAGSFFVLNCKFSLGRSNCK